MGEGKQTCETCRWWGSERAHDADMPLGTCRRQIPMTSKVQALSYSDPNRPYATDFIIPRGQWLWTAFDDWCGEHQPKAPPHD